MTTNTDTTQTHPPADANGRREHWPEGSHAWFECHSPAWMSPDGAAHSGEQITVLAVNHTVLPGSTLDQRIEDGNTATYWVGHTDGTIGLAYEDELFISPDYFYDTEADRTL